MILPFAAIVFMPGARAGFHVLTPLVRETCSFVEKSIECIPGPLLCVLGDSVVDEVAAPLAGYQTAVL